MRRFVILISILGLSVLVSGCRNPLTGKVVTTPFFEKQPAEVLRLMKGVMADVQTVRSVTDTNLEASGGSGPLTEAQLSQKITVDIDRPGKQAMLENRTTLGISGTPIAVTVESFFGGGKTYFRFTQLPLLPGFNLQPVKDVWFSRDLAAELAGLKADLQIDEGALAALQPRFDALAREASWFRVEERLLDEAVDGVNSYHYRVTLDEAGLTAFSAALAESLRSVIPVLKDTGLDSSQLQPVLASLRGSAIELWIGKDNFRLLKISVAGTYSMDAEQLRYDVQTTFSHFNERFIAAAPAEAKPVSEFATLLNVGELKEQLAQILPFVSGSLPPGQFEEFEQFFSSPPSP